MFSYTAPYDLEYAYPTDSGMDVRAWIPRQQTLVIKPKSFLMIPTGVHCLIPPGMEIQVRGRSSLASRGVGIVNGIGTIDEGYTGEICALLFNLDDAVFYVLHNMKIAQLVLAQVYRDPTIAGKYTGGKLSMEEFQRRAGYKDRGNNGFGSTGV